MREPAFLRWLLHLDLRLERRARAHGRVAVAVHEFLAFGIKQASACLFGGIMVALLFVTWRWYPADAALARYDFVTIMALAIQGALIASRLESREEAAIILLFHVVGTTMELFKTAAGSWIYPEPSLLRIGGVPLFSGFMYASVGSYIARAWRLFDLRFMAHPPFAASVALAVAIYVNFYSHHYVADLRPLLFAAVVALFGRTWVHFRIRRVHRRMPLLLGFFLVAGFIWLAENAGTFSRAWLYPAQRNGWNVVPVGKLGAWLLLLIISYVMVSALHRKTLRRGLRTGPYGRKTATIGDWPSSAPGDNGCSRKTSALKATTTNWPRRSPPSASARKTTSN